MSETVENKKGFTIKRGPGKSVKVTAKGEENDDEIKKYRDGNDAGSIKTTSASS